jgi:heme/copper-type cytochrome/quinol oxidase subunit 1
MTITENRPEVEAAEPTPPARRPVAAPSGLAGWVMTADHKRIGRMYISVSLVGVAAALVVGALLAVERVDSAGTQLVELDAVVQLLSLYRYGLVFVGVLPLLLGLAIAIVPLQVGAYRIAFGRAAALSFWGWLIGSGLMIAAYAANGGPGGGNSEAVDLYLLSLALVVVSLLLGAVCVVTTALTLRTAGMTLGRMPILAWGAFVTGVMLLLSLSVLVGDLIMVYVDHHYGRLVFGGNTGVPAWIDWSVSQPQTYLYALIGLGAIGDIVPVMSRVRQPLRFTVLGALGVAAALSFGGYLQESMNPDIREEAVYVVTNVVAFVPVLALLALWGQAIRKGGKPRLASPLFFSLGAGLMALVGALAGALTPIDGLDLHGTQFELGQFNYVLLAGLLAGLGGVVFWGPKLWGRRIPGRPLRLLAVLGLLGVILIAFPDLVLGFLDQPLGEVNFELDQEALGNILNAASFVGYLALFLIVVAFAVLALRSFGGKGQVVPDDPWDGQTLEWTTTSPPPSGNFTEWVGEVASPEPLLDRKPDHAEPNPSEGASA